MAIPRIDSTMDFELPLHILRQNPNNPGNWQRWSHVNHMWLSLGDAEAAKEFGQNHKEVFVLLSSRVFTTICSQAAENGND